MTALPEYERLECPAIWHDPRDGKRRNVILSFGASTLVITDERSGKALAHWSLPALIRLNPGKLPARYRPMTAGEDLGAPSHTRLAHKHTGRKGIWRRASTPQTPPPNEAARSGALPELPDEELEITDETMIGAIEKIQSKIEARRPHPGRLRAGFGAGGAAFFALLAVFWLPGAATRHVADVAPPAKRIEIGRMALKDLATLTGQPCHSAQGDAALERLAKRLKGADEISILPEGLQGVRRLPGHVVAVGLPLLTAQDTPEVAAGHIIAAELATEKTDPLVALLEWAGFGAAFKLLTTGELPADTLAGYGEHLLREPSPPARSPAQDEALLAEFAKVGISSTPYAFSLDPSGETVLGLIEADPFKGAPAPEPVMADSDWIALQTICDG